MSGLWTDVAGWWLRLALAGGLLLLAGIALVALTRRPAIRLRTSSWVFAAALLVVPLTLFPGWLKLPWNIPGARQSGTTTTLEPQATATKLGTPTQPTLPDGDGEAVAFADAAVPILAKTPVEEPASALAATPTPTEIGSHGDRIANPFYANTTVGWIANILLLSYGFVVLVLLIRLAIGQWRLERLWRSGSQAPVEVRRIFHQLTRRFRCRPALRVSDRVTGPICFGVLRPRLVIPAVLAQVANEQALRWIISHELSHLRRKDPLIGLLIGVAQSVFFFVPWFWKLRRDVRLNQEFLADAAAVDASAVSDQPSTNSAADYADFLVRLTCAGRLPVLAAGVKSPSSDLYRRVAMLLQKSGTVETNCPRRWSLLAGGGLLALGIVLGGLSFSSRNVAAEPDKKSVNDVEEEIRKALESLKKGLEAKKEKEEKPPVDLNPIDEARKAEEALKKAQEELRKNPTSDEARKAFQEAVKKYQETMRKRVPAVPNLPNFPEFPQFPPIQPLNPADFDKEIERINEQMQKAMEELQRQMQLQPGFFPPNGRMPFGGLRNINRRSGDSRLGIRVERPTPILVEQLDLPPNKGMVVTDVVPQSAGDKAGIKINDILLEIGAKQVTSELGDLQRMMREFKADEKVDVVLLRKGKKETIKGVTLPEAKPEQVNPFAPRFQFPNVPFNPPVPNVIPPGGLGGVNGTTMSVQVVNGDYTIKYQENGVKVTILGAKDDGQFKPSSIEIDDNGKTSKAESLEKVDAAHRPLVEKVLKQIR